PVCQAGFLPAGSLPPAIAEALAVRKAEATSTQLPDALVIGADQVLALGAEVFRKPASVAEAREQLLRLRGKTHALHSAVALALRGKAVWVHTETATLAMRRFTQAFLADYLARVSERVCRTVGAYEIQGPGIQLMERVEGDLFTVI